MERDTYQSVTDRIVAELEKGAPPWVKPWSTWAGMDGKACPRNAITKRPYAGINRLLLGLHDQGPLFLTFHQAHEAGGHVRAGEHGTPVVIFKDCERAARPTDPPDAINKNGKVSFKIAKMFTVFAVQQCEGLELRGVQPPARSPIDVRDDCERFLRVARVEHGHERAAYSPALDMIVMPDRDRFASPDGYYQTAFHELGHWTGHASRLARDFTGRFGSDAYAVEELVAELASAYECQDRGIDGACQHAAYLDSWLRVLKADKRAIFTAASKAQAAADMIFNLAAALAA